MSTTYFEMQQKVRWMDGWIERKTGGQRCNKVRCSWQTLNGGLMGVRSTTVSMTQGWGEKGLQAPHSLPASEFL